MSTYQYSTTYNQPETMTKIKATKPTFQTRARTQQEQIQYETTVTSFNMIVDVSQDKELRPPGKYMEFEIKFNDGFIADYSDGVGVNIITVE